MKEIERDRERERERERTICFPVASGVEMDEGSSPHKGGTCVILPTV